MNLDFMTYLVFLVPGAVVLIRFALMLWPEEALPERMRVKKDPAFKPTVAVIIPCYNEGRPVYDSIKSISESDYPQDRLNIYPQDDGSHDDSFGWMMKASYDFPNVFPEENGINLGKTRSYLRATERSESEITMIIDSDTTVAPNAIAKMMQNFADPKMGVVGAVAGIANPNHNMLTAVQTQIFFLGLRLSKISESHFQGVSVIGGFALAVRRLILLDIKDEILNRNWFGVHVKDGEDRFITNLSQLRGWNSYVEQEAEARTFAMPTYEKYFGQQMRWKRSMIRTFFWLIRTLPRQVRTGNIAALFALYASFFTLTIAFAMLILASLVNPLEVLDPARLGGLLCITTLFTCACMHAKRLEDQRINNPLKMILFPAWWMISTFFFVVLSVFTLDSDAWGNREIKTQEKS